VAEDVRLTVGSVVRLVASYLGGYARVVAIETFFDQMAQLGEVALGERQDDDFFCLLSLFEHQIGSAFLSDLACKAHLLKVGALSSLTSR